MKKIELFKQKSFRIGAGMLIAGLGAFLLTQALAPKTGLSAVYFWDKDFQKPYFELVDKNIDFIWGQLGLTPRARDHFTVRWTGYLKAPASGGYVLKMDCDDGFRLWIDGNLIQEAWPHFPENPQNKTNFISVSTPINLTKGLHEFKLEYIEHFHTALLRLYWKKPGDSDFSIIPSRYFDPGI